MTTIPMPFSPVVGGRIPLDVTDVSGSHLTTGHMQTIRIETPYGPYEAVITSTWVKDGDSRPKITSIRRF